jgi:hypothetical protein
MIQYLDHQNSPIQLSDLRDRFINWGYSKTAVNSQLLAMANKDVLWTSAGPPSDIVDDSNLRLSYRGELYLRHLLHRVCFNYMMSFDTHAPSDTHPIFRNYKHEFRDELTDFATFNRKIGLDAVAERVLGLAELIFEAEKKELQELKTKNAYIVFKSEVAPNSISIGMVEGLANLMQRSIEDNNSEYRFIIPSNATLQSVSAKKDEYRRELAHAW